MALRKLRRGVWPVQDASTCMAQQDAARKLLAGVLHEATQREMRCVL